MSSCFFLEHHEKFENVPRYRDIDKDWVMTDARLQGLNNTFARIGTNDAPADP